MGTTTHSDVGKGPNARLDSEPGLCQEKFHPGLAQVLRSDSGYGTTSYDAGKDSPVVMLPESIVLPSELPLKDTSLIGEDLQDPFGPIGDDQGTIYTDPMSNSDIKTESYVSALAENLYRMLNSTTLTSQGVDRMMESLPDLLKALALNIGYKAPSQEHRDIMVFIHKFRL